VPEEIADRADLEPLEELLGLLPHAGKRAHPQVER